VGERYKPMKPFRINGLGTYDAANLVQTGDFKALHVLPDLTDSQSPPARNLE